MFKRRYIWVFIIFLFSVASLQAKFKVLYSFTSSGNSPHASLISGGSTSSSLYGMTYSGGSSNSGTIFKIQTNGTGFKLLHSFAGGATDGVNPRGSLISISSVLYGMTEFGGSSNSGTIFKIQTNGTGFKLLHSFAGGATDGANPLGSLISISSVLYGMTLYGGPSNAGTIFKIQTNGLGYALLHSFSALATDGRSPLGSLIKIGSTLYGMTQIGGASNYGTIFKLQTNGTGFILLYSFTGGATDGMDPSGSLKLINSTLYGMTTFGGTDNLGTIFRIKIAGTGFQLLHSFSGGATDGRYPWHGSLLLKNSILFGMTSEGGAYAAGVVFSCGLY